MGSVFDATAKKIKISAKSQSRWNVNVKETRKAVRRDKWRRRNMEDAARANAKLQKSIWQYRSEMWSEYLESLRGVEVWRAAWYANSQAGTTTEAFTERERDQAARLLEKEKMVRLVLATVPDSGIRSGSKLGPNLDHCNGRQCQSYSSNGNIWRSN